MILKTHTRACACVRMCAHAHVCGRVLTLEHTSLEATPQNPNCRSYATHPWILHAVAPPPVGETVFTDAGVADLQAPERSVAESVPVSVILVYQVV